VSDEPLARPEAAGNPQSINGHQSGHTVPVTDEVTAGDREPLQDGAPSEGAVPDSPDVPASSSEVRPSSSRPTRGQVLGGIREIVETVVLALIFFLALRAVVQNFRVEGSSMYPSFVDGQYVLVNKAVYAHLSSASVPAWLPLRSASSGSARYLFHAPERGAVIVFHPPPPNDPSRDFIKRVIGVPGDTVDVRQGHVFVNGAELSEPFIHQATLPLNVRFAHVTLGPDQYYVMGDNRGNSSDSRAWGPVSADAIVGRTWLVYWPVAAWKFAPNFDEHVPAASPNPAP
jgi:signal peptidase I